MELQGLRNAAFSICALATIGVILWVEPAPNPLGSMIVLAVWIALSEGGPRLVDWWYHARYGRASGGAGISAALLMTLGAALDVSPWFPYDGRSGFVIIVAVHGLWVACRDFPWRGYHVASLLLLGLAPFLPASAQTIDYLRTYATVLGWLALIGLLDHQLLRILLRRLAASSASTGPSA